jgi:hypothetical protein
VVAAMSDTPTRAELAELYRDSDRFAAETDNWLARHKAERAALARKNADDGVMTQDDDGDAILAAPASDAVASDEELDFTDAQFDALATVIAELRREFEAGIERTHQRLLNTMVRLALPGERAEETFYALRDRVSRLEGQLERQLADIVERHLKAVATEPQIIDLPGNFFRHTSIDRNGKITMIRRRRDDAA